MLAAPRAAPGIDLEQLAAQHVADEFIDLALPDQRDPTPRHALDLDRIVSAGADVGEHEARYALRLARGQRQSRAAAEREADDRGAIDLESIEHADKIAREVAGG